MKKQSISDILSSNYHGLHIKSCVYNKNTWEVEVLCFCGNEFKSTFEARAGYGTWRAMHKRCYQPSTNGYQPGLQIDRINSNGNFNRCRSF